MNKLPTIIAEVKTCSPYDGELGGASWDERFEIAEQIGDIISIHTNPRWGGNMGLINKARKLTDKPILAKGLHLEDKEIKEATRRGADKVLVVGRIPDLLICKDPEIERNCEDGMCEKLLIEPYNLKELEEFVRIFPDGNYVWNSRNLQSGVTKDPRMFSKARALVRDGTLCQASNISSVNDIFPCADSVLVGAHIEKFRDSIERRLS